MASTLWEAFHIVLRLYGLVNDLHDAIIAHMSSCTIVHVSKSVAFASFSISVHVYGLSQYLLLGFSGPSEIKELPESCDSVRRVCASHLARHAWQEQPPQATPIAIRYQVSKYWTGINPGICGHGVAVKTLS
jgi:hypothetical protein